MSDKPDKYDQHEQLEQTEDISRGKIEVFQALRRNEGGEVTDTLSDAYLEKIGEPEKCAPFWEEQETPFDCGIASQKMALEACGRPLTAEQIRRIGERMNPPAYERNDPDPNSDYNGTHPDQIGYAFETQGVGRTYYRGDLRDPMVQQHAEEALKNELRQNHAVICAVEPGTLEGRPLSQGHALWVTGASFNPHGDLVSVYCNDSGRLDGQMKVFDGQNFLKAWERYSYRMVATKQPMRV